ncbi:hypothetical protein AB1K91_05610 [Terribacillus sp. 179-K 1B1 HS]|uniref:hypothetical protein n=1 Tax=Terribacillus sp. 179-K 1B1 HS TaxID=3142388 RepID=UPI0039A2629F
MLWIPILQESVNGSREAVQTLKMDEGPQSANRSASASGRSCFISSHTSPDKVGEWDLRMINVGQVTLWYVSIYRHSGNLRML